MHIYRHKSKFEIFKTPADVCQHITTLYRTRTGFLFAMNTYIVPYLKIHYNNTIHIHTNTDVSSLVLIIYGDKTFWRLQANIIYIMKTEIPQPYKLFFNMRESDVALRKIMSNCHCHWFIQHGSSLSIMRCFNLLEQKVPSKYSVLQNFIRGLDRGIQDVGHENSK